MVRNSRLQAAQLLRAAAAVAVLVALTGCGNPVQRKVEKGIERALPGIIGPAESYRVNVTGSALGMLKGKLSSMSVVGKDVQLPNGMRLAELTLNTGELAFDKDRNTISRAGSAEYSATISEMELNRYLVRVYPSVPGLFVELFGGTVRMQALPKVAGVAVRVNAEAGLKVRDARYLILDLRDVEVIGVSTPGFAREFIHNRVNPVFDAATFGYDATIQGVQIRQGALRVNGTLDLARDLCVER